jgi:hypothetical protein
MIPANRADVDTRFAARLRLRVRQKPFWMAQLLENIEIDVRR